ALDVEDDRRDLGEVSEPDEFLHQRDTRPGGRGEGARAVPGGTDDDADRGELILGLDDRIALFLGLGVTAVAVAMRGKGLGKRGRGGDRVPGGDGRSAKDATESGSVIAIHEDAVANLIAALEPQPDRAVKLGERPVAAQIQ